MMSKLTTPAEPTFELTPAQRAGVERIKQKLGRQFSGTDKEVHAWRAFVEKNLKEDGGHRFSMSAVIRDVVDFPFRDYTLCWEGRKSGTPEMIRDPNTKESPLLFEGPYTEHHADNDRVGFRVVTGYNPQKYYKFIQDMLEAYLDLEENTLIPEDVIIYGERVPMSVRLLWKQNSISFLVECDERLYDEQDKGKSANTRPWYNIYARWSVRTNPIVASGQ